MTARETYDELGARYDRLTLPLEGLVFERMRRGVLSRATGRVLEIGVGTGKNLDYYPPVVHRIVGVDLSSSSLDVACHRAESLEKAFHPYLGDAERLPFEDGSFDTVVSTLAGCTFDRPLDVYREMRRLCRPDGRALFMEHTVTNSRLARGFLWVMSPLARRLHCDAMRDNWMLIQEAGFTVERKAEAVFGILIGVEARP
jgi:demethylmenaquinone methyltransferase/2-methoxy-6-polyprenyl-1,4-benzoquinol methylase